VRFFDGEFSLNANAREILDLTTPSAFIACANAMGPHPFGVSTVLPANGCSDGIPPLEAGIGQHASLNLTHTTFNSQNTEAITKSFYSKGHYCWL